MDQTPLDRQEPSFNANDLVKNLDDLFASALLKPMKEFNFRDLANTIVYFQESDAFSFSDDIAARLGMEGFPGFFAYGYVDHESGLSFKVLCPAGIQDDLWVMGKQDPDFWLICRAQTVENALCMPAGGVEPGPFQPTIDYVDQMYACSQDIVDMRASNVIDALRHPSFPDDIIALLAQEGQTSEKVWVRLEELEDGVARGVLLSEPQGEFGVHAMDMVTLQFVADEHENVTAVVKL